MLPHNYNTKNIRLTEIYVVKNTFENTFENDKWTTPSNTMH